MVRQSYLIASSGIDESSALILPKMSDAPRFVIDTLAQSMHELLTQEMYGFVYPDEEAKELCGFIEPLLALDPTKRSTPEDALGHSWLVLDDVEHDSPK